jgi:hypothetical protein
MELSPSWKSANCVDTQELPNILWNPKVYYCSQEISTGPYSEPDQSSACQAILSLSKFYFSLI